MKKPQLSHEQITKLADDIRVIQDFTASHNFDLSLLNASVSPSSKSKAMNDKALVCTILFIALLLTDIAAVVFSENISEKSSFYMLIVGAVLVTLAVISIHKKFSETAITVVASLGLAMVLLVGFKVYTPKQAVEIAQSIVKKDE